VLSEEKLRELKPALAAEYENYKQGTGTLRRASPSGVMDSLNAT
jgi:hypothetical protein